MVSGSSSPPNCCLTPHGPASHEVTYCVTSPWVCNGPRQEQPTLLMAQAIHSKENRVLTDIHTEQCECCCRARHFRGSALTLRIEKSFLELKACLTLYIMPIQPEHLPGFPACCWHSAPSPPNPPPPAAFLWCPCMFSSPLQWTRQTLVCHF